MPDKSGVIAGATFVEKARQLAGALAELGVLELHLSCSGASPVILLSRQTDLPGLLAGAGDDAVLSTPDGSIRVSGMPKELRWQCGNAAAAAVLRAASVVS